MPPSIARCAAINAPEAPGRQCILTCLFQSDAPESNGGLGRIARLCSGPASHSPNTQVGFVGSRFLITSPFSPMVPCPSCIGAPHSSFSSCTANPNGTAEHTPCSISAFSSYTGSRLSSLTIEVLYLWPIKKESNHQF
jgi:hypothetical protein